MVLGFQNILLDSKKSVLIVDYINLSHWLPSGIRDLGWVSLFPAISLMSSMGISKRLLFRGLSSEKSNNWSLAAKSDSNSVSSVALTLIASTSSEAPWELEKIDFLLARYFRNRPGLEQQVLVQQARACWIFLTRKRTWCENSSVLYFILGPFCLAEDWQKGDKAHLDRDRVTMEDVNQVRRGENQSGNCQEYSFLQDSSSFLYCHTSQSTKSTPLALAVGFTTT